MKGLLLVMQLVITKYFVERGVIGTCTCKCLDFYSEYKLIYNFSYFAIRFYSFIIGIITTENNINVTLYIV